MKIRILYAVILSLGLAAAASCKQSPIFSTISNETAPRKPRIEGAPTNMAVFEREYPDPDDSNSKKSVPILYVASGKLHWYAKEEMDSSKSGWDLKEYPISQPQGKITYLAATPERLYALCMAGQGIGTTLRYITKDGEEWKEINSAIDYPFIQSIYADPDTTQLFVSARNNSTNKDNTYAILYLDNDNDTLKLLKGETEILSGAVSRNESGNKIYYLCTQGDGIFKVTENDILANNIDESTVTRLKDEGGENENERKDTRTFVGIIKLNDAASTIIAVERKDGILYKVQDGSFSQMYYTKEDNNDKIMTGKYATGALSLWEDYLNPARKLLIAGIQGGLYNTTSSSYTHGYVEFDLTSDGSFNTASLRHDPGGLTSVDNNERYPATIGKHPINYLFQAPDSIDSNKIFFASTQTVGLWSYKDRNDGEGPQWNAEE